jgi:hypothetical protein
MTRMKQTLAAVAIVTLTFGAYGQGQARGYDESCLDEAKAACQRDSTRRAALQHLERPREGDGHGDGRDHPSRRLL